MIQLNYVAENKGYQNLLDTKYHGTIVPVGKFINGKATILHYCYSCSQTFFAKPGFLVNLDSQQHSCLSRSNPLNGSSASKLPARKDGISEEVIKDILHLFQQGFNKAEIGRQVGIKREAVRYQLKKMGY